MKAEDPEPLWLGRGPDPSLVDRDDRFLKYYHHITISFQISFTFFMFYSGWRSGDVLALAGSAAMAYRVHDYQQHVNRRTSASSITTFEIQAWL